MLRGEHVTLRPFEKEDLRDYHQWWSDYEALAPFQHWREKNLSMVNIEKEFQEDGFISDKRLRFIMERSDGKRIGFIGATSWSPESVSMDIGFIIGKVSERGKGYGTEATRLLVDYLFSTRPIIRIDAWTGTENVASRRVLEKNGFVKEGVCRKTDFFAGEYRDMAIYSILRDEWEQLRKER